MTVSLLCLRPVRSAMWAEDYGRAEHSLPKPVRRARLHFPALAHSPASDRPLTCRSQELKYDEYSSDVPWHISVKNSRPGAADPTCVRAKVERIWQKRSDDNRGLRETFLRPLPFRGPCSFLL